MWHYDSGLKACRRFWYGGCQRNKNRFDTEAECQANCEDTGSKDGDGKDGKLSLSVGWERNSQ